MVHGNAAINLPLAGVAGVITSGSCAGPGMTRWVSSGSLGPMGF